MASSQGPAPAHRPVPRPVAADPRDSRLPGGIAVAVALLLLLWPAPFLAQTSVPRSENAGIPAPGEVRVRWFPAFQAWDATFTPKLSGDTRPLASPWRGPLLELLYPGPESFVDDINFDATALGYDSVAAGDVVLGRLDMREVSAEVRTVPLEVEVGVLDRLAVDLTVPLVRTEVESFSSFDPSGATFVPSTAVATAGTFFTEIQEARDSLKSQIESGSLSADREEEARRLLAASGAFADALSRRLGRPSFVPMGGTPAGTQMLSHYGGLVDGFGSFGLSLPSFSLPAEPADGALSTFVAGPAGADSLESSQRGFSLGEVEVGVRVALLDQFRPDSGEDGLRLRTTLGVRARLPLGGADGEPFIVPSDLVGIPVGDGQRDVELALYQEARVGGWLRLTAVGRYGIQTPHRVEMRIRPPDRPLALPSTRERVERDLGDYVAVRFSPRLVLDPRLSIGAEYRLWRKGKDAYRVIGSAGDATPLEIGTGATRHRLGLGAVFDLEGRLETSSGAAPQLGFVHQLGILGSGVRTPAAGLTSFWIQVPAGGF